MFSSCRPALPSVISFDALLCCPFADSPLDALDMRGLLLDALHEFFVDSRDSKEDGGLGIPEGGHKTTLVRERERDDKHKDD